MKKILSILVLIMLSANVFCDVDRIIDNNVSKPAEFEIDQGYGDFLFSLFMVILLTLASSATLIIFFLLAWYIFIKPLLR